MWPRDARALLSRPRLVNTRGLFSLRAQPRLHDTRGSSVSLSRARLRVFGRAARGVASPRGGVQQKKRPRGWAFSSKQRFLSTRQHPSQGGQVRLLTRHQAQRAHAAAHLGSKSERSAAPGRVLASSFCSFCEARARKREGEIIFRAASEQPLHADGRPGRVALRLLAITRSPLLFAASVGRPLALRLRIM